MKYSRTNKEFADLANPHSWVLVADNLHTQAVRLRNGASQGSMSLRNPDGETLADWPVENRAIFLLSGFALENMLKAFLVYQNPAYVANGRLAKKVQTHNLVKLSEQIKDIPWPIIGKPIIQEFQRGLTSWARYPCALYADQSEWEQILTERLWCRYKALMHAYGARMMKLLERGWSGPHGSGGAWSFEGDFLSSNTLCIAMQCDLHSSRH